MRPDEQQLYQLYIDEFNQLYVYVDEYEHYYDNDPVDDDDDSPTVRPVR